MQHAQGVVATADRLGRPVRDLRVSVTDRCNFRCRYCMPREVFGPDHAFLEREELLSFEEIRRVVAAAARCGVRKVRLTGGEPLLRRDLPDLVAMLAAIPGIDDLALTTNASLLRRLAVPLREAGLTRVTVSLDALDDATFRAVSDVHLPVSVVLDGVAAAREAGFGPVKLNAVIKRGVNEHAILPLAGYAREHGDIARFIEFMDVGSTNGWRMDDVVPASEILATLHAEWPLAASDDDGPGVAARYRYLDGGGEVGVISSVTQPFCRTCVRARLSAIGELYTCLFATRGHDLRSLVRDGASPEELADELSRIWSGRSDRYSEGRTERTAPPDDRVEMSYIGG